MTNVMIMTELGHINMTSYIYLHSYQNHKRYTLSLSAPTVPLKSKLPPSRETRLVSLEIGLERNETSLERNETSLVSRECTGSTNASHSSAFETCY